MIAKSHLIHPPADIIDNGDDGADLCQVNVPAAPVEGILCRTRESLSPFSFLFLGREESGLHFHSQHGKYDFSGLTKEKMNEWKPGINGTFMNLT